MKTTHFPLWGLILLCCSCSTELALQQIFGSGAEAPVFLGCKAVSPGEISFQFNRPVEVSSIRFDPPLEVASVTGGDTVRIALSSPPGGGVRVVASLLVEDAQGNTLDVLVPFRIRNDRIPAFTINEICTAYGAASGVEFVEIKTGTGGNLGALRLFTASSGLDKPLFEFPPVEVGKEYIVIHLRTLDQYDDGVNETGADLNASSGREALPDVRDFWVPGTKEILRDTDAVLFMDQDDRIIDAVMFYKVKDSPSWDKFQNAAELLSRQRAWLPAEKNSGQIPGPLDAVDSTGTSKTQTICRDEHIPDSDSAADWYIVKGKASPGKENNGARLR
jgi:hypothetical protein